MNDYGKLKAKIVTIPGYVDASTPSDEVVRAWLAEDDDQINGPWVDVDALNLSLWMARHDLNARVEDALEDTVRDPEGVRQRVRPLEDPQNAPPPVPRVPFADPGDAGAWNTWASYWLMNANETDACFQLRAATFVGRGIESSVLEVRQVLAKLHDRIITTAERDDLLGVARPPVTRYAAPGTDWTVEPGIGDVAKARAL